MSIYIKCDVIYCQETCDGGERIVRGDQQLLYRRARKLGWVITETKSHSMYPRGDSCLCPKHAETPLMQAARKLFVEDQARCYMAAAILPVPILIWADLTDEMKFEYMQRAKALGLP